MKIDPTNPADLSAQIATAIRDAVEPAGAEIAWIAVVRAPLPLEKLADAVDGTRFARLDRKREDLKLFGERLGRQFARGGGLIERVQGELFSSSRGEYGPVEGIVFIRDREGLEGEEKALQDHFESALISGMLSTDVKVVGVERRDTDPSQIRFMADHDLPSVDDLDLVAGKTALVYVLLGAEGQCGGSARRTSSC
ncbi:hypothetical protein LCGC14_2851480, partial [marine sediment metagenome]